MKERETVGSYFYSQKFKIHGHLRHDFSPPNKIRWYVYCIEDLPCRKQIIGSTQNPSLRWANYKSTCNKESSKSTGLAKHFMDGCPFDQGKEKPTLSMTLIDFYDTTEEKINRAGHVQGPKCRCEECNKLKELEDQWIFKMGSYYGISGLNTRDETKSKTRYTKK